MGLGSVPSCPALLAPLPASLADASSSVIVFTSVLPLSQDRVHAHGSVPQQSVSSVKEMLSCCSLDKKDPPHLDCVWV